jgi:hypothetical protein
VGCKEDTAKYWAAHCGVAEISRALAGQTAELPASREAVQKAEQSRTTTGRSAPEEKGQLQPQGWTGPLDTRSGGAAPESPQGQSPPGMQPAPDGSTKTVVEPHK